jgi:hypothetical protein
MLGFGCPLYAKCFYRQNCKRDEIKILLRRKKQLCGNFMPKTI